MANRRPYLLACCAEKVIETVKKGADGLKDEQMTFLNTSVQALETFMGVLYDATANTSSAVTSHSQIQQEVDCAVLHIRNVIFSSKSLLVAAGPWLPLSSIHLKCPYETWRFCSHSFFCQK